MAAEQEQQDPSVSDLLHDAGSKQPLQRDRAIARLKELLSQADGGSVERSEAVRAGLQAMLQAPDWEPRFGALHAAQALVPGCAPGDPLLPALLQQAVAKLEDPEPRVRWAAGQLLGELARRLGPPVWEAARDAILGSIDRNFDRDALLTAEQAASGVDASSLDPGSAPPSPRAAPAGPAGDAEPDSFIASLLQRSYRLERPGSGEMRHGSEGWRSLETSFRALHQVMAGCGPAFQPLLEPSLLDLIYRATLHPNRFIREACHLILATVCGLLAPGQMAERGPAIAGHVADGLSDNWSQVRYPAAIAARAFMQKAAPHADRLFPLLVPQLCFNRYYTAEGVRRYCQETWRLVMGDQGRAWVARCAPQVVAYYIIQSKANNYAVRESACNCVAELMTKVDSAAVRPHVPQLLRALLTCFKDKAWPVRSAACLACGDAALAFPEETKEASCSAPWKFETFLPQLWPLWLEHLSDNIYSVREDAAVALGNVMRAYGREAVDRLLSTLRELLPGASQQPAEAGSRRDGGPPSPRAAASPGTAGTGGAAALPAAAIFRRGGLLASSKVLRGADCCMDGTYSREKQPWERTDGAIYLLRELARVAPDQAPAFLPDLAEAVALQHFSACRVLQQTAWAQLPAIASAIGIKAFKPHLEPLLRPLFDSLVCGHQLCAAAAGQCLGSLRDSLGPRIFAGRLTEEQQRLMAASPDVPLPAGRFVGGGGGAAAGSGALPGAGRLPAGALPLD